MWVPWFSFDVGALVGVGMRCLAGLNVGTLLGNVGTLVDLWLLDFSPSVE